MLSPERMKPKTITTRLACLVSLLFVLNVSAQTRDGSVQTVQLQSMLLNATLSYDVILPLDYRKSPSTRYPVLYLLHGLGGHYSDWVTRTNVADYAAQYRMIVITPEGNNGWYVDSGAQANDKYESYVLKEIIPDVQKRFRTIESRYGRGIAGLSMGGYGALKFALKSPEVFAFAGSVSGSLAIASATEEEMRNLKSIYDAALKTFGPIGSDTRKANDIFEILRNLSTARAASVPYVYLDCGTEDPFFPDNIRFAALLREKKIPHEFRELPGNHSWPYWDQQVREVLRIAAEKLRANSQHRPRRGQNHPGTRVDKRAVLTQPKSLIHPLTQMGRSACPTA